MQVKHTPMIEQYLKIKESYKDALLFYRLGDFYELFFDDAVRASKDLDIVLTSRGTSGGKDVPMCGVPVHSYQTYIKKLIEKGYRVAVCEQLEVPSKNQKGPVKRDVVRVLTRGTLTETDLLEFEKSSYLMAFSIVKSDKLAYSICDLSTGFFRVEIIDENQISDVLYQYDPREILIHNDIYQGRDLRFRDWKNRINFLPEDRFHLKNLKNLLEKHFGVLDCYGLKSDLEVQACGILFNYLMITQKQFLTHIQKIERLEKGRFLLIDEMTRKNLEIMSTLSGKYEGSLHNALNRTVTAPGLRLFTQWLSMPLIDVDQINKRLDDVEFFLKERGLRVNIREILKNFPDCERGLSRISLGRGGPRDLGLIRNCLSCFEKLKELLVDRFNNWNSLYGLLNQALNDCLPSSIYEGNFIREGFSSELDEQRALRFESKDLVQNLENRYRNETGINNLKIKFNNIWGFYIEVTASHRSKVPDFFIHKQTLSSNTRYVTKELDDLQQRILQSEELIANEERKIYEELCQQVINSLKDLQEETKVVANLDVILSFSTLSEEKNYKKPLIDRNLIFDIRKGRHPVLDSSDFIGNDCILSDERRFVLITGPNMGGKSTYLRQNALIALMAHIGCFVPAEFAQIGVLDRIMSRVGASDDLTKNRSTFMVEMVETASIMHQATKRSFVILDEVGRGTSTSDGIAIAWAVCEHLLNKNLSKVLFATHYHELSELIHEALIYKTVEVQEWKGKIVFLHQIKDGVAKKSYGIHVAEIAGLPKEVIDRAYEKLDSFQIKQRKIDFS